MSAADGAGIRADAAQPSNARRAPIHAAIDLPAAAVERAVYRLAVPIEAAVHTITAPV